MMRAGVCLALIPQFFLKDHVSLVRKYPRAGMQGMAMWPLLMGAAVVASSVVYSFETSYKFFKGNTISPVPCSRAAERCE